MWPFKKKKIIPVGQADPPPTTRSCVMEIVLVNNHTDKEYMIKSETDFGLTWEYVDKLLLLKQKYNIDGSSWKIVSHFTGFSMAKIIHQTFNMEKV